jgi:hypothetical protein
MKVKSILDTDLYLFSVSYYFMKNYPEASGTLVFNDRNKTVYTREQLNKIIKELHELNPNMQIILSTHAPSVITGWHDKVREVNQLIKK